VSGSGVVDTSWKGSVLLRDLDGVRRLREEDGPTLLTQGSTELVHALLAADLVDALSLLTFPVVLGAGKKLFADGSVPHAWKLTRTMASGSGIVVAHYERGGEVPIAPAGPPSKSSAEAARQERMKREG
jgi:dihydrofolate reductase